MKRPRLPRRPRVRKPSENVVLVTGFFGGLALAAAAIALIYLPGGLLTAGVTAAAVCGLLALAPEDHDE